MRLRASPSRALGLLQSALVNYDVVVPWLLRDPLQGTRLPPHLRADHAGRFNWQLVQAGKWTLVCKDLSESKGDRG